MGWGGGWLGWIGGNTGCVHLLYVYFDANKPMEYKVFRLIA